MMLIELASQVRKTSTTYHPDKVQGKTRQKAHQNVAPPWQLFIQPLIDQSDAKTHHLGGNEGKDVKVKLITQVGKKIILCIVEIHQSEEPHHRKKYELQQP